MPNSQAKRSGVGAIAIAAACWSIACGEPNLPPITTTHVDTPTIRFAPVPPVLPDTERTLLQELAARPNPPAEAWDKEARGWVLPYSTKRLDVVLIIGVAHGDKSVIDRVLAPHAEWGPPDRRRIDAKPIYGPDGGQAFFAALHSAAMRFPENATWKSQPTLDAVTAMYATGAEPMWTVFEREGQGDWIVFRKVMFQGRPVIDYVGLWPDGPPGEPQPEHASRGQAPPIIPPIDRRLLPPS